MSFGEGNLRTAVAELTAENHDLETRIDKLMALNGELCAEVNAKDARIRELESLLCDMMELDKMRHGPFSWERIERMQDIRGSVNARLIKMGFVQEVDHAEAD